MSHNNNQHHATHGSYGSYVVGFILSIVLTLVAYVAIVNDWFTGMGALLFVTTLAVLQLFVQLLFFLHMGQERGPRWNFMTFVFAGIVVFIVVIGSIWIMYNLDYNMTHKMTPEQLDQSIIEDEGLGEQGTSDHHHEEQTEHHNH